MSFLIVIKFYLLRTNDISVWPMTFNNLFCAFPSKCSICLTLCLVAYQVICNRTMKAFTFSRCAASLFEGTMPSWEFDFSIITVAILSKLGLSAVITTLVRDLPSVTKLYLFTFSDAKMTPGKIASPTRFQGLSLSAS